MAFPLMDLCKTAKLYNDLFSKKDDWCFALYFLEKYNILSHINFILLISVILKTIVNFIWKRR